LTKDLVSEEQTFRTHMWCIRLRVQNRLRGDSVLLNLVWAYMWLVYVFVECKD